MKDNFSAQAAKYAQFRPTYPQEFYAFIIEHLSNNNIAWDCATGNGQVALELAKTFDQVYATDISAKQLANAPQQKNISYKIEEAEKTAFADNMFDLITVAQAIHWFKFDDFFKEASRVLKPDGLFVAIGYGLMKINPELDKIINYFYRDILGNYWDEERKHIDNNYKTIPFPFQEIESPSLEMLIQWNFVQLIGYLETWSSLQHYLNTNGQNPINLVIDDLKKAWAGNEILNIHFPLIIKAGRLNS